MDDSVRNYLGMVYDACIQCGLCGIIHSEEGFPPATIGDVAASLLAIAHEAEEGTPTSLAHIPPDILYLIRSCSLCNACTIDCPQDIDCAETVRKARSFLRELEPALDDEYRAFRVDHEKNAFSRLRELGGVTYPDVLMTPQTPTAKPGSTGRVDVASADGSDRRSSGFEGSAIFFPGCTLATYAPDLTKKVYTYLQTEGLVDGMSALCCGNPLASAGLSDAYGSYTGDIVSRIEQQGITRIIVSCPNCYRALIPSLARAGLPDVEVTALPELLFAQGMCFKPTRRAPYRSVSIHDSCPDRICDVFGSSVRSLFEHVAIIEMLHHGRHTLCCGSGGLASSVDPGRCALRCNRRLDEFEATGADCLVTSCVSCINSFLRSGRTIEVRHYLELVFDLPLDWASFYAVQNRMWTAQGEERFETVMEDTSLLFDGRSS